MRISRCCQGLAMALLGAFSGCGGEPSQDETAEALSAEVKGGNSDPNLHVEVDRVRNCKACFKVTADKNITHIFVKVHGTDDYKILVDGKEVEKLHDKGGPCNHGVKEILRDVWFPLTGNQKEAEVCVVLKKPAYAKVSVGAKAASACEDESTKVKCKKVCEKGDDHKDCDKEEDKCPPPPMCPPPKDNHW